MEKKISLITSCSNRLHHLKKTLPANIRDNEDYENVEFLVLDHNSSDGLEGWIMANMEGFLSSGRLKFFRTLDKKTDNQSYPRNLAFSLASGEILCNVDPHHFTGCSFASHVNEVFSTQENIVITPIDFFGVKRAYYVPADLFGLCCVRKADFHKVGGFDESMNNYGFEHIDFINRLEMAGVERYFLENIPGFNYISYGKEEKYSLKEAVSKISRVFVAYREQAKTEWVIQYADGSYERFLLVDKYALESPFFVNAYTANHNRYQLYLEGIQYGHGDGTSGNDTSGDGTSEGTSYTEVFNELTIRKLVDFKFTFHSRYIMEQNVKNRIIVPNRHGYGKGNVRRIADKIVS